ncbi:amidohydrolase [Actinophytocola xinjiangensis]|uniref:Amidohydrolase n=1 Tax=Actinophytocola xinjiangensis TaxID=485602 RepID=A0A7Z0WFR1_9PSEU|nr:M20 family metallopeptidase [Actinophytocola xinjiangensis]OLF05751.1 amidohydrolase [Actinophytocola xinjiangensis]
MTDLVELRRAIHAEPEIGLDLPATQRRVLDALAPLDLEITLGEGLSSVVAVLRGAHPGPVVLLRGDMDALPLREETGLPYASTNGAMHACGHDLHTAGLVGAAHLLAARRADLHGSVVFMFQPGEETGQGAALMIEEGVLDAAGRLPDAAYAVHVVPGERGVFSTRPGPLMAGALELRVSVRGQGGHASEPHQARNPVPAVTAAVDALHTFVTRRFSVFDPVVLTVTALSAGGPALNIIAEQAGFGGSVRVLSAESLARVRAEIPPLVESIAAAHGCTAEVDLDLVCPPTTNDEHLATEVLDVLRARFGEDRVRVTPEAVMGGEDFSHVLARVPGVYFFLRATPPTAPQVSNHSPTASFDDSVLADQAAALAALALRHLEGPTP